MFYKIRLGLVFINSSYLQNHQAADLAQDPPPLPAQHNTGKGHSSLEQSKTGMDCLMSSWQLTPLPVSTFKFGLTSHLKNRPNPSPPLLPSPPSHSRHLTPPPSSLKLSNALLNCKPLNIMSEWKLDIFNGRTR